MPAQKTGQSRKQKEEEEGVEFDFPISQQSNDSDEQQQMIKAIEKQYAAAREKKKAQKEKKFIDIAKTQLDADLVKSSKEVKDACKSVEEVYRAFLEEYAAVEDRIHTRWMTIHEWEDKLAKMVAGKRKADEESAKTAIQRQESALAKTKASCKAFQATIDRLLPVDPTK